MAKKTGLMILLTFMFFTCSLSIISAINLEVSAKPIQNAAITTLKEPAVFELIIRNLGDSDKFEIYSLVGVDITPETFSADTGETKKITIKLMPQEAISEKGGFLTFEYKIKDSKNGIQQEKLTMNIISLGEAFAITPESITPQSETIKIEVKNKLNYEFSGIKSKMSSVFFTEENTFSLKSYETKTFEINLNSEKVKTLTAGSYLLNTRITVKSKTEDVESLIKFLEQEGIETTEVKEGILIKREETAKTNVGNTIKIVKVIAKRNIFSYLFTTFNIVPIEITRNGFKVTYTWEKELVPNEKLNVIVKTNWFYPIIVIIFTIVLFVLIRKYVESDLILRKQVSFVRTRGGEFALKISLRIKAKKFIEKINIIDKLPPLVSLYERYGAIAPDKIDLRNKRIEWNVESLNEREERIFTYIIYSKIGVVGKFELPSAKALYEKEGKIKEATSNRSFYINEPKKY